MHGREQLAHSCYSTADWLGVELAAFQSQIRCSIHLATKPHKIIDRLCSLTINPSRLLHDRNFTRALLSLLAKE